jgi:ketosteroid isomerase-like protein
MARSAAAVLLVAALAVAGCGGGGGDDRADVRQTMREFVTALNKRDADEFCEKLITRDFVEKQTFAKGDKAIDECKRQLKQTKGLKVKLARITSLSVKGDDATVHAVLETPSGQSPQLYRLKKEDGGWRISGGSGG